MTELFERAIIVMLTVALLLSCLVIHLQGNLIERYKTALQNSIANTDRSIATTERKHRHLEFLQELRRKLESRLGGVSKGDKGS